MLIDETLSVGDSSFKNKAKEALKKKIESCYVLLVSHDMKTLREMCQAGLLVHEGKLHFYEDIDDAIVHYETLNQTQGKL
jgi:capsular polysaccharide transport system ATP-binding protein